MKPNKPFLSLSLAASLALISCSGAPKGNNGNGTNKVSFVLVADTPPANLGLISFRINVNSVTLTSATGTKTTLSINGGNGVTVDLVRAQSDSAFLGTLTNVETGGISSITVSLSNAEVAFFNGTGATITNLSPQCLANTVCSAALSGTGTPVVTQSESVNGNTGFGIDFNLANALSVKAGALTLNLTNSTTNTSLNVVGAFALPRANANLATGELDLIEDFTGVAAVSGSSVTISSNANVGRGSLKGTVNSSTVLDSDPSGTLCKSPTPGNASSCVANSQVASMDAVLHSDGTITVQELEPLLATPVVDTVEGTVVSINSGSQTQFGVIVTDLFPAASNSLIGTLRIGAPLTVNLAANVKTFLVDTKGLPVAAQFPNNFGFFNGATNTTALHLGQNVAVHVTTFTAANGTTAASASTDTVTLRWSRFISTVSIAAAPQFSVTALPSQFGVTGASTLQVQSFGGTQGTEGVTNLDGINGTAGLAQGNPVAIRALFIENAGDTLTPAFFAAKVRQH